MPWEQGKKREEGLAISHPKKKKGGRAREVFSRGLVAIGAGIKRNKKYCALSDLLSQKKNFGERK